MKIYLVIETCCNHFQGLYTNKEEAEAYAKEFDYDVREYLLEEN